MIRTSFFFEMRFIILITTETKKNEIAYLSAGQGKKLKKGVCINQVSSGTSGSSRRGLCGSWRRRSVHSSGAGSPCFACCPCGTWTHASPADPRRYFQCRRSTPLSLPPPRAAASAGSGPGGHGAPGWPRPAPGWSRHSTTARVCSSCRLLPRM